MKRTATTLVLLAGLGSGCVSPNPQQPPQQQQLQQQQPRPAGFGTVSRGMPVAGLQGPGGEPVMAARASYPAGAPSGVVQAGGYNTLVGPNGVIRPVSGFRRSSEGCTTCSVPGVGGTILTDSDAGFGSSMPYGGTMPYGGPMGFDGGDPRQQMPRTGIVPVPTMGPPGAVAAFGAMMGGPGGMGRSGSNMPNGRSSINFTGPAGMKVTWQLPNGGFNDEGTGLTAPKEYNFMQGAVYRLRLSSILPDHPGKSFYPTLEIAPASPKTLVFLSHSSVPLTFTSDDFAQAKAGNLVVKVIYLPDSVNQDFSTIVGAEEVVSTRLEPGADPIAEAQRRGTIMAIIRMGNIDLENRESPAMTAPPGGGRVPPPYSSGPELPPAPPQTRVPAPAPASPPGTASVRPPAPMPTLPTPMPGQNFSVPMPMRPADAIGQTLSR